VIEPTRADGRLRAIVCAALYAVAAFWLFSTDWLLGAAVRHLASRLQLQGLSSGLIALDETTNLLTALLLTGAFAWYEQQRIDSYGFPLREAFGARFWEGFAIGAVNAGAVTLGMIALGGMAVHGLALHGAQLAWAALGWLGTNILVGLAEELLFRGYLLQTLWKGLSFWPAAVLISLWFAADHYFFKQGENIWDVITLVSLSLWVCYSVLRTGTLWLAIGYHAAFDYMQLFVIGTPNGSVEPEKHLLSVSFQGPAWVTGGVLGTEASLLMYPAIVLMFVYVGLRFRGSQ
jgi:membrane protease YdiL (CAAX protease family)